MLFFFFSPERTELLIKTSHLQGGGREREREREREINKIMTDSNCRMAETDTTL